VEEVAIKFESEEGENPFLPAAHIIFLRSVKGGKKGGKALIPGCEEGREDYPA